MRGFLSEFRMLNQADNGCWQKPKTLTIWHYFKTILIVAAPEILTCGLSNWISPMVNASSD